MDAPKYKEGDLVFIVDAFGEGGILAREVGDSEPLRDRKYIEPRDGGWVYFFRTHHERWVPERLVFRKWGDCFTSLYFETQEHFLNHMITHMTNEFKDRMRPLDKLINEWARRSKTLRKEP